MTQARVTYFSFNQTTELFHYQVLVVITDGEQTTTKAFTELTVASQGVKNKGVAVYAVGVGKGANQAELNEIASAQQNVFVSASFKELQNLAVQIRRRLCNGQCHSYFTDCYPTLNDRRHITSVTFG